MECLLPPSDRRALKRSVNAHLGNGDALAANHLAHQGVSLFQRIIGRECSLVTGENGSGLKQVRGGMLDLTPRFSHTAWPFAAFGREGVCHFSTWPSAEREERKDRCPLAQKRQLFLWRNTVVAHGSLTAMDGVAVGSTARRSWTPYVWLACTEAT